MTRTELFIVTVGIAALALVVDLLCYLGPDGIVAARITCGGAIRLYRGRS